MCRSCGGGIIKPKSIAQNNVAKLLSYSDKDFIDLYYLGEYQKYIGKSTNINYGFRDYGQKFMVHKLDYNSDLKNFVTELTEATIETEPLNIEINKEEDEIKIPTVNINKRRRRKRK